MKALRLVLVSRRFWPLVGGPESTLASLGAELLQQGHCPHVLTAQWEPSWPAELVHRDVRVTRLPQPHGRFWGHFRYQRALRQWLEQHRSAYDLVYVAHLQYDAYAALSLLAGTSIPVVLRAEGVGVRGDVAWQRAANFGRRIKKCCHQAAAIVASTSEMAAELRAVGYDHHRICEIPPGVELPEPRTTLTRSAAREALAEACPGLEMPLEAPLVVFAGRLHESKGLRSLVEAFTLVLARYPSARLWLVGDGPERADLMEHIGQLGWTHRIALPGAFDDLSDVLAAADLFVLPATAGEPSRALYEALAAGLPVVASDLPGFRALMESGRHGVLVPPRDAGALAQEIITVLATPRLSAALGAAARERMAAEFTLAQCAARHVELFQRLLAEPPASGR